MRAGALHRTPVPVYPLTAAKIANGTAYQRVLFRPRVLRKVSEADASTELLGCPSSIPVFIAPAAMAKLGHPLGEINLTRGAGATGIIQGVSSLSPLLSPSPRSARLR